MESIITNVKDVCLICGSKREIDIHHCLHGTSNRKNADKYGLTVPLCHSCHMDLHDKNTNMDGYFKRLAQMKFEERYSREEWFKIFGKSFL